MRRSIKLLVLLGCLIAVCLATLWTKQHFTTDPNILLMEEGQEIFACGNASNLTWRYGETEITFHISGEQWVYDGDPDYVLSKIYQKDILAQLTGLKARKIIDEPGAPEEYGLDEPICTVTADDRTLYFGDVAAVGGLQYVSVGDGKVYMVSDTAMYPFSRTLEHMMQMPSLPELSDATAITITKQDTVLQLVWEEEWYLLEGEERLPVDAEISKSLNTYLKKLSYTDCLAIQPRDISLYGLAEPAAVYAITYSAEGQEQVFTLSFGTQSEYGICVMEEGRKQVFLTNQTFAEFFSQLNRQILLGAFKE